MSFAGVFAPLPTPFNDDDDVDVTRWRAALTHWLATPLTGFVVLGSNGEAGLIDDHEAETIIGEARALIPRSRPLIVGVGRESTIATVRNARRAAALGADAVLVRTPGLFKAQMTGEAFIRHYRAVADASPAPVLLYNFAAFTGVNLSPATVAALATHPNIVGIKESGSDLAQLSDFVTVTSPDFSVLAGSASTFFAALSAGAVGGILALAGLLPDACVALYSMVQSGRFVDARNLQRQLLPVARLISATYGVPGLKAAFREIGVDVGLPRPPLASATAEAAAVIRDALTSFRKVTA